MAEVADELKLYYPIVEGGTESPLIAEALEERVAWHRRPEAVRLAKESLFGPPRNGDRHSGRPVIGDTADSPTFVAVVTGEESHQKEEGRLLVKSWVVSEEDAEEDPAADPAHTRFSVAGDVEIALSLAGEASETAVDRVIDGFLRFFFKIGYDHTRFQRGG